MMAIFILRFVRKMNNWLHRREFGILQEQFRSRVRASPNPEIRFLGGQVIKAPPLIDFQNAPLIQNRQEGRMTWHPIPVVQLGPDAPLTKDWVSTKIVMPATVRQGKVLAIRIDITNNHATKDIVDQGLLEIRHPTSVAQALGPDAIKIQPNGDTVSLYYTWNVPYIPGNYVVKYHLLNLQARTEKAVVVK
jgi:hypothetical protein